MAFVAISPPGFNSSRADFFDRPILFRRASRGRAASQNFEILFVGRERTRVEVRCLESTCRSQLVARRIFLLPALTRGSNVGSFGARRMRFKSSSTTTTDTGVASRLCSPKHRFRVQSPTPCRKSCVLCRRMRLDRLGRALSWMASVKVKAAEEYESGSMRVTCD